MNINAFAGGSPSRGNMLLLKIFLPFFAMNCMVQIYYIFGTFLERLQISPESIGWILSSFFIAAMLSRPFSSWVIEHIGMRFSLAASAAVCFIGCLLLSVTDSVSLLLLGRILAGAGFGVYSTGIFAYSSMVLPEDKRASSFALLTSSGALPMATVIPLGEWLFVNGHSALYMSMGPLLSLACLLLALRLESVQPVKKGETWGSYSQLMSADNFLLLSATVFLYASIDALVVSFSLLAAAKKIVASYFLASISIAAIVTRVGGAGIINRIPRRIVLAPCGILMAISVTVASFTHSAAVFILAGALFGVASGAGFPVMVALISDLLDKPLQPKGTSSIFFLYDAGCFMTPIIIGYLTQVTDIVAAFRMFGAVVILTLFSLQLLFWIPRYHRAKDS